MSLLDLYAQEQDRATAREWANPTPLPEPSFNLGKTLGAGKAVAAGAMEALGSFFDLAATGSPGADMRRPGGLADQPDEVARRALAKAAMAQAGRAMRARADDWMPDPQTAHWSQQAVAGLTRFGAKAVFDVGLFGPVIGAPLLGLDEANTTAQRLMDKGIDSATAWQVGGVTGALSAVGAVMPMAGTTLTKTAGLVALGGPVQYMVQEGLAKKILQNAGYDKEAALHDPTDPLGIGIATTAAALFGAAGAARMRSVQRLESVRTEQQAQAAMHLSPEEQARSDAFERSAANLKELRAAVDAEKRPEQKAILQAELDKQTKAAAEAVGDDVAKAVRHQPEVVDAARVALLDEAVARGLPDDPQAHAEVLRAMDEIAAGRTPVVPDLAAAAEARDLDTKIEALQSQREQLLPQAGGLADRGEVASAKQQRDLMEQTRPDDSDAGVKSVAKQIQADEGVSYKTALSAAKKRIGDALADWNAQAKRLEDFVAGNATAQQATDALAHIDRQVQELQARREAIGPVLPPRSPVAGAVDAMMREARSTEPSPLAAREERTPAVAAPREVAAPKPGRQTSAPHQAPSPEAATAEAMAKATPDMQVRLPGTEKTVSLADALEQIRAAAKDEAGFADLVQVAAQCALTGGLTGAA